MKKHRCALKCSIAFFAALTGLTTGRSVRAATNLPPPVSPPSLVSTAESSLMKGLVVYSIRFPGGSVSSLFNFLQTNGFGQDNVLIAGRAGEVYIPEFTVHNVRLREIAKSIEFMTEDRVKVEVVERGEAGDANIWRIKPSDTQSQSVRACPIPRLLSSAPTVGKGRERVDAVVDSVSLNEKGYVRVLEKEKIAVAIGSPAYAEGVSRALEAAEQAAAIVPGPLGGETPSKPDGK